MIHNKKYNPYYASINEVKFLNVDVVRKQIKIAKTWSAYIPEKTSN